MDWGDVDAAAVLAFLDDCISNAAVIYVRDQIGGKWGSYSLAELPGPQVLTHVRRWLANGQTPIKVRA